MQNILFRTDSSSTIGTGHIMRDLVLAQQYKDSNIIFAVQNLEGNINHKILEAKYNFITLESNSVNKLIELIEDKQIDLLIIDHYGIDYSYEKEIKEKTGVKILVFDDTYEKHYCDILLNHNISADETQYKNLVPNECELQCGSRYTLLREEFLKQYPPKKSSNKLTVLVAMGGVDSRGLNIPILNVLQCYKDLNINIVTTTANKSLQKLQIYVKDKINIILHINTDKIAQLMHESDFAIITPSVIVNEVHFMKLPFIAIKTEENQKHLYNYLQSNNYLAINHFNASILKKTIDTQINIIQSSLINFIDLSLADKKMILEWRNDISVRRWMFENKLITLETHLNYIDSLTRQKDRVYFLVKLKKYGIGVVDLTTIKNASAELGIYLKPGLKGFGYLLMYKILIYAFEVLQLKRVYANVFIENYSAIKLYKKFHFIEIKQYENIISLELKNENR